MVKIKPDWTELQNRLDAEHTSLKLLRAEDRKELAAHFKEMLEQELSKRAEEREHAFARNLKTARDAGMPVGLIQNEVLHTTTWRVWQKWVEMADIPTAAELSDKIKREAAQKAAGWSYDPASRLLTLEKTSEKYGNLTLNPPYETTVPADLTGLRLEDWNVSKDEWYAAGYPEKSYVGAMWTAKEIVEQLWDDGAL